ncbi:MAG TPA: hypothetical protein VN765_13030 [Candidatus Acidoferrum sp.]|nr:hypothetical protein [Candidatus Acidoferrum sp.]
MASICIGPFHEGVMSTTNFSRPKPGAITHLTLDELNAFTARCNAHIKPD